jgi:hypothetical protein
LKDKILQVQAGMKCSILLSESRKIYWFGSNATISDVFEPTEFILSSKVISILFNKI